MPNTEKRRELSREFIKKVVNNQNFDATADLAEMIRMSKKMRYDRISTETEI